MKKIIYALLLSFTMVIISCKKEVKACIEMDKTSISVNESITFTSCSSNELSYDWRIKGPDTAPENNKGWSDRVFTNTFTVPGTYTVTLTVYSDFSFQGESDQATANFTVN